jgi:hypothetical protein
MAEPFGAIGTFVLVICINAALIFGQVTMNAMAADEGGAGNTYYSDNGSLMCQTGQCDAQGLPTGLNQAAAGSLPQTQSGASAAGGGTFTDLWTTVMGWVKGGLAAGGFLLGILSAPMNFMFSIGLTGPVLGTFAVLIGIAWEGFSLLVIINFIRGT